MITFFTPPETHSNICLFLVLFLLYIQMYSLFQTYYRIPDFSPFFLWFGSIEFSVLLPSDHLAILLCCWHCQYSRLFFHNKYPLWRIEPLYFSNFKNSLFLCSRTFSFSLILFNAFQISPHHSQAQCGHTEYLPMFSTLFIYFFQIKPLNFLYFFCLKNKFRCIHRLPIDVDKSNFFIPKHFSMEFLCEGYGEGSGKV